MAYPNEYYSYGQKCPIWYGSGIVREQLGAQLKKMGCRKVFLVTDEGLSRTEIVSTVVDAISAEKIETILFGRVSSDPTDAVCEEGAAAARKEKVDCIIGLGGGSSLDAAKAINILYSNPSPLSQYYGSMDYVSTIPLIEIPTTTGTGSECTSYSVITDTAKGAKQVALKIADMGFCDPELTMSLPVSITAATGMDAFAHAAESMTGLVQNPHTDACCYYGIRELMQWLPIVCENPLNEEGRNHLMMASNMIGIGVSEMGCHLGHAIGQSIGAVFHTPHGISCGWALPVTIESIAETETEKVKLIGEAMGMSFPAHASDKYIGKQVSVGIIDLMHRIGIRPMQEYGITKESLIQIADLVMKDGCFLSKPNELTKEDVEVLLGACYDAYKG